MPKLDPVLHHKVKQKLGQLTLTPAGRLCDDETKPILGLG